MKYAKRRYDEKELAAMHTAFSTFFISKTLPSTAEILAQQKLNMDLRGRTWQQIKTWISNQFKKK